MNEFANYLKEQYRQVNERHHSEVGTRWKFEPMKNTEANDGSYGMFY